MTASHAAPPARGIPLERRQLDDAIAALSSAARSFRLTPFERVSYFGLVFSVDAIVVGLLLFESLALLAGASLRIDGLLIGVVSIFYTFVLVAATVFLIISVTLIRRTRAEARRLDELGLQTLSISLWKESRRSNRIRRFRELLIVVAAVGLAGTTIAVPLAGIANREFSVIEAVATGVVYAYLAMLLLGVRHLQNQRDRLDMAANAGELARALDAVRDGANETPAVTVPAKLFEQAARLEASAIAKARRDVLLRNAGAERTGYAIAFDPSADRQKAGLTDAARFELQDLLEQLSAARAASGGNNGAISALPHRRIATGGCIEIEYSVDSASRRIRITSIRDTAVGGQKA